MQLSKRLKGILWGSGVGAVAVGLWCTSVVSDPGGEPMLIPPQTYSTLVLAEVRTGVVIFLATGVPVGLIVALRPTSQKKDHRADQKK